MISNNETINKTININSETPKEHSKSLSKNYLGKTYFNIGSIQPTQDTPLFEEESNRSSRVFEKSRTQRINTQAKFKNIDMIRVSSLKDLLRLFRINLVS